MPQIRVKKSADKRYTMISNVPLQTDKRLSAKAKGILAVMLSFPDNWTYSVKGLASFFADGAESIRSGIKELEKYGYVVREQQRLENGKMGGVEYIIYEEPQDEENIRQSGLLGEQEREQKVKEAEKKKRKEKPLTEIEEYDRYQNEISEIIEYLNQMAGTNFRPEEAEGRRLITKILDRQFTVDDCKTVVWKKTNEWIGDVKMRYYIRPKTLFGPKFESYLRDPVIARDNSNGGLWI